MKRKELISEIYRLNKVTHKLNYYMNRYYPDQKLRKLEHFQVEKVYEWMLSDLKQEQTFALQKKYLFKIIEGFVAKNDYLCYNKRLVFNERR